ncbi:hypothetical protein ABW19_dt0207347 [Dactylella cylindrospora]|nr:hypothetical protein ABW19_dt0207347 [Dactylella cylindrospora]
MAGRSRAKRGQGGGRAKTSRSSAAVDDTTAPSQPTLAATASIDTQQHTPLAPPSRPLSISRSQISPQTPPHSPPSSSGSKRKFEDIAEAHEEDEQDSKILPPPASSFSANASIMSTSERPSRKRRSTYTLAASIASIERNTRTRSRATVERSVTRNPLSSGFSKPNDSEKLVVKSRDGRECWLCSQSNSVMLETAHNVVASNRDLFLNYRDTVGIFPPNLRHLASPHNLVTLCRNCHCVYDCQQPRWIILPTNLEFFINHEMGDYESRILAASKGVTKPRSVPTALEYATSSPTNLYMPYFFEESVMPRMEPEEASSRFPRAYGGAPTTMILKAGLGINQPKIKASKNSSLPFTTGIPASVRQQVTRLFELWDRDPPSPKKQPKSPAKTSFKDEDQPPGSETDENSSQSGSKKRRTKGNPNNRKRKSPHASQTTCEEHQDELADICAPTKKKARMANPKDTHKSNNPSPDSQTTNADTMTHTDGRNSQGSSANKRYNLRSHYRTPPTSPEFGMEFSSRKKATGKTQGKAQTTTKDTQISKRKRISTSSESVLQKRAKKVAKATGAKKDGRRPQTRSRDPKVAAAPLTPARSRPSPNDPIPTKRINSLVKASGVKKRKGGIQESPARRSIKKNTAALFGDIGEIMATAQRAKTETDFLGSTPVKNCKGKQKPQPAYHLLHMDLDTSMEIEQPGQIDKHYIGASNNGSLDAQSGGDNYDGEHDDGYASDSGSERPDKEDWAWGPSHTANDVVETCVGWFGVGTSGRISD